MMRVNLLLDSDTAQALERFAQDENKPRATAAKELIREGLKLRESALRKKKLARDYAAGRTDSREVLQDLEVSQLSLLDEDA